MQADKQDRHTDAEAQTYALIALLRTPPWGEVVKSTK